MKKITNNLKAIKNKYKTNTIWFGGDFNLPDIDWQTNSIRGNQYPKEINETATNMINECGLFQLINFPTRQNNCLDILLTNNKSLLTSLIDIPGISDHTRIPLADTLCHPFRQKINKRTVHLWNRANVPDIKETLVRDIKQYCDSHKDNQSPINSQWTELKTIFNRTMEKIPSKELSQRHNQPWISRECKRLSRRKKRLYRRAKRTKLQSDWERFKVIVKECKRACRSAHDNYVREKLTDSHDSKKFYKYIKSKNSEIISVAPLRKGGKL